MRERSPFALLLPGIVAFGGCAAPVPPRLDESDFTIVYGKGEARVTVDSFNGPIRVKVAK